MKSHLGWTACSVIAAVGLMATALTVEAETGQNLVVNGDFESGNSGFTTGYAFGNLSGPVRTSSDRTPRPQREPMGIGATAATIRREMET